MFCFIVLGYKNETEVMTYYSKTRLHYCLKSRRNELNYIRSLVGFLIPIVCSKSVLQSKYVKVSYSFSLTTYL